MSDWFYADSGGHYTVQQINNGWLVSYSKKVLCFMSLHDALTHIKEYQVAAEDIRVKPMS